jgi:tetratricopeptide (TPR) repeat protein
VINDDDQRTRAYLAFDAALATARELDLNQGKARALASIAQPETRPAGGAYASQEAAELSNKALLTDELIGDDKLPGISKVKTLLSEGRDGEALKMASQIGDYYWKSRAYVSIALAQQAAGRDGEALGTVALMGDDYWKARAYYLIAQAQMEMNRHDDALKIADRISDYNLKAEVLISIAKALVAQGRDDEALRTASRISDYWKGSAYISVAKALVAKGCDDEALKTAELIGDPDERATAYISIAQAQAAAGRADEALEVTQGISVNRGIELPKVALAFVNAKNSRGFKKLLLPSSYHLNACYEMSGMLALLYPEQAADIAKVLEEQG